MYPMKFKMIIGATILAAATLQSCTKEPADPVIPNQEELITTLTYTLVAADNSDTATFMFADLDGPGGNAPIMSSDVLKVHTLYIGTLVLLNEQLVPAKDITDEVAAEGDAHQFFFESNLAAQPEILYTDADVNGNPIGIATTFECFGADAGQLVIILRHEPDKFAAGVNQGDITNAGGETDIEISFDLEIK